MRGRTGVPCYYTLLPSGLPEYNPEWYFQMTLHTLRGDCSESARNLAELLTMTTNDNKAQAYW